MQIIQDYCISYSFYTCALLIHERSFILVLHIFLILKFITLFKFDIHFAGIHDRCLHDIYTCDDIYTCGGHHIEVDTYMSLLS